MLALAPYAVAGLSTLWLVAAPACHTVDHPRGVFWFAMGLMVFGEMLLLAATVAVIALVVLYTVLTGSPPMPSSAQARDRILRAASVRAGERIVDTGCGLGTLVFDLARCYPSCEVVGYERSPLPWLIARMRQAIGGYTNVTLVWGDFRGYSLNGTGLLVCYLDPCLMRELRNKLESELQPGATILSTTFAIPGWQPSNVYRLSGRPVYIYRVPGAGQLNVPSLPAS